MIDKFKIGNIYHSYDEYTARSSFYIVIDIRKDGNDYAIRFRTMDSPIETIEIYYSWSSFLKKAKLVSGE